MATDKAFFVARSGQYNDGLWVTDGTAAGTRQLQVAGASAIGLNPSSLVVDASGTLFFEASDGAIKPSLWVSNGTDAGTHELSAAGAPANGLSPEDIVAFGRGVAFTSLYGTGLWFSDGTAAGTTRLTIPSTPANGFYVSHLTAAGGKLYFSGSTSTTHTGLWVSDGTSAGTQELQVAGASSFGLTPRSIASLGNKLVLDGTNASFAEGLWVSDGTAAGTVALAVPGLNPTGRITGGPAGLFAFGAGKAAFAALDASGQEALWVTDGTVAGTQELPGTHVGTWGAPMAPLLGGKLAFVAADASGANQVWVTDGTAAGTQELQAPNAAASLSPGGLVSLDGRILFDGLDSSGTRDLWTSDGTSAGTFILVHGATALQSGYTTISATMPGTLPSASSPSFTSLDTVTSASAGAAGETYTGPVSYLAAQFLWSGTDSVNLRANTGSVFLRGGPGTDALQAASGSNVLDGGTGSNFLVGANGYDGGVDTFFIDARGANVTWSTLVNFHPGDAMTLWGFTGGQSTMAWAASDGAQGYTGATIHTETGGAGTGVNGSVTFAGVNLADAQSKFTTSTGSVGGNDYLYIKYAS